MNYGSLREDGNLVAHWNGDSDGDGTGDFGDRKNSNDGTQSGTVTFTDGDIAGNKKFNTDTNDFIIVPDTILGVTNGTLCARFTPTTADTGTEQYVFGCRFNNRLYITVDNDLVYVRLGSNAAVSIGAIADGETKTVVLTWNSSSSVAYLDGVDSETSPGGRPTTAVDGASIGAYYDDSTTSSSNYFLGTIEDVMFFDRELSSIEAAAYNLGQLTNLPFVSLYYKRLRS